MKNSKKPTDLFKRIKKLSLKPGDIVVVTLKGLPFPYQIQSVHDEFATIPFMKDVEYIITTEKVDIKKGKIHEGKHQVFLDNLDYLEYLAKHKKGD